jgi:hypothetical protein
MTASMLVVGGSSISCSCINFTPVKFKEASSVEIKITNFAKRREMAISDLQVRWDLMTNDFIDKNLLQVSPISVLQLIDFRKLYFQRKEGKECNMVEIFLEAMIKEMETLKKNVPTIREEASKAFNDTLHTDCDDLLRAKAEAQVDYIVYMLYKHELPDYKEYLARWKTIITDCYLYQSRTSNFINASIQVINELASKPYRFDARSLFCTIGANPKFFYP